MTPLEFTFGNRQKPTDICSDFYFKIWTVSHNHRSKVTHTHTCTHSFPMQTQHKLSSLNLLELLIFHSVLLSASNGVFESVHTSAFQYLRSVFGSAPAQTLPSCLSPYFVVRYPERLITRLKGAFKGRSILRGCSTVCVHCQVLVGGWADQPSSTTLALTNTG